MAIGIVRSRPALLRNAGAPRVWWKLLVVVCLVLSHAAPGASAEEGDASDVYMQGFRAFERGDQAGALGIWKPLAERGDPRAQFGLGLIYEVGFGSSGPDEEEALRWYRQAARQGLPAAQNNLGLMYAEGRAVTRDPVLAVTLWREAAEAGYGPAQFNLAMALQDGMGVGRNESEAKLWFERAKEKGITQAEAKRQLAQELPESSQASASADAREPEPAPPLQPRPSEPAVAAAPPPRPAAPAVAAAPPPRPAEPAVAAAPPPRPAAPAVESEALRSGFYVQLASVRSQEGAVLLGRDLSRSNADLLADLEPTVRTVDLGEKGVWHRVLFGPLPTRERAAGVCEALRAHGGDCLVAAQP
jgi:cell division protein FtsN